MNDEQKASAERPEADPSEVAAEELNPEEQEDVSGGDHHNGWIEIFSNP